MAEKMEDVTNVFFFSTFGDHHRGFWSLADYELFTSLPQLGGALRVDEAGVLEEVGRASWDHSFSCD